LNYSAIEKHCLKTNEYRVTGPGASKGYHPNAICISKERIQSILLPGQYIDTEALDAALSLIEKKLSQDNDSDDNIVVYTNTTLRLIFNGEKNLVSDGYFIAIFPKEFGIQEEDARMQQIAAAVEKKEAITGKDVDVKHFTLVSNIHCGKNEVNVYETLNTYRQKSSLLTDDQKRLLKILMKSENDDLLVNCVNVIPQKECECAAISIGLAVKLCFTAPGEKSLFEKFVRKVLKRNHF